MAVGQTIPALILGLAAFYWISLPPDRVVFDQECEPQDLMARFSATVHGERFWRGQRQAAETAITALLAAPASAEHAADQSRMNSIEQRMTRLSSPNAQDDRQMAVEQRERLERVGWLRRCHEDIGAKRLP